MTVERTGPLPVASQSGRAVILTLSCLKGNGCDLTLSFTLIPPLHSTAAVLPV